MALLLLPLFLLLLSPLRAAPVELKDFTLVISTEEKADNSELIAPRVLTEEMAKRTGLSWTPAASWPAADRPVIAIASRATLEAFSVHPSDAMRKELASLKPEGFVLDYDTTTRKAPTLWILGADGRGALFGTGKLLRTLELRKGSASLPLPLHLATSPAEPLRGHQLGFRPRANSWDAWTVEQFEQHIRDLVIFGNNAIENIPFQDSDAAPHIKVPRREMNKKMGEICARYGIEYWVWTPAEFKLDDRAKIAEEIKKHEEFYADTPRLDGVFFPGGDPGDNPAHLVLPFLEEIAKPLSRAHPKAKVWLSLQSFTPADQEEVYTYVRERKPAWLGGLVCGPSSPGIPETRARLDPAYKLRSYPDITHIVRCQFPAPQLDRTFSLTLGRECINYRMNDYKLIHNIDGHLTDGFISYSDGVHDDANKIAYLLASWDPNFDVREGMKEYARFFVHPDFADRAADGMLALENHWRGPLASHGAVDGTLALFQGLEREASQETRANWRFQMMLFRAYYDAYERHRLIQETQLEAEANNILRNAGETGSQKAIEAAREIFARSTKTPARADLREAIFRLADELFKSIALQTSVEKYKASGSERGCSLDFVDYPLNNRRYDEYRFPQILALPAEPDRVKALKELADWENPGPGGFYDDIGDIGRSPRVLLGDGFETDPEGYHNGNPEFAWANGGNDVRRPAWQDGAEIRGLRYQALDRKAKYKIVVSLSDKREIKLKVNGIAAEPLPDPPIPASPAVAGKFSSPIHQKAWRIPAEASAKGTIELIWEVPGRRGPRHPELAEAWLIRE